METKNATAKPQGRARKILRIGVPALAIVLLISHFGWKMSGSNEWKLFSDKDGTKIWTLKTPGSTLIKVKAVGHVRSRLSGMVRLIENPDSCEEAGCTDSKVIDNVDTRIGCYTAYNSFRFNMPFPMSTREYVVAIQHRQNPQTKQIEVNLLAAPNKTMPLGGCVRVTHMHNIWRLTPTGSDTMEVEYVQDFDMGGRVPYFVTNLFLPEVAKKVFHDLQGMMDKEKYRKAQVAYVMESGDREPRAPQIEKTRLRVRR